MPAIDPKLGNPVTTRIVSWQDQVLRAWGSEWAAPDHRIYVWSNDRAFDSTDLGKTGIYGVVVVDRLIIEPVNPTYADMYQPAILNETGGYLGQG